MKIGDSAYFIRDYRGHKKPEQGIVAEIIPCGDKQYARIKFIGTGEIGKRVFPTLAEAQRQIEEETNVHCIN